MFIRYSTDETEKDTNSLAKGAFQHDTEIFLVMNKIQVYNRMWNLSKICVIYCDKLQIGLFQSANT